MKFKIGERVRGKNLRASGTIVSTHVDSTNGEFYYRVSVSGFIWSYDEEELMSGLDPNDIMKEIL